MLKYTNNSNLQIDAEVFAGRLVWLAIIDSAVRLSNPIIINSELYPRDNYNLFWIFDKSKRNNSLDHCCTLTRLPIERVRNRVIELFLLKMDKTGYNISDKSKQIMRSYLWKKY